MSDKISREIIDILKAVPCKEEPDLPFKMPENPNLWVDFGRILAHGLIFGKIKKGSRKT